MWHGGGIMSALLLNIVMEIQEWSKLRKNRQIEKEIKIVFFHNQRNLLCRYFKRIYK